MATSSLFAHRISALRRRIFWQRVAQFLLFAGLSAGSLSTLIIVSERFGWISLSKDATFYAVIAGVSAVIASVAIFLLRKPLSERLIEFDTRLRLRDELSTAYEYQCSGKSALFAPALIRNAGQRLSQLDFAKLLPFPLLKFALWCGGLLLIHLSLLMVDGKIFPVVAPETNQSAQARQETIPPEKLTTSSNKRREQRRQKEQRELFQKMNELAQNLENREMPKQEFASAAKELLQDVQSQQDQLLEASDGSQTLDNLPIKQLPSAMSPEQLQNMEKLLGRMLQEGGAQDGANSPVGQEELDNLRNALSEMAQNFEQGDDSGERDGKPTQSAGQDGDATENTASSDTPDGSESSRSGANAQTNAESGDERGSEQGEASFGEGMPIDQQFGDQGQDSDRDGSANAGLEKGDNQRYEPSKIDASKGQVVADKINPATEHDYSAHIRSVTRIGNANAPTKEVIRPYRQELESVLQQEKLPLNYREYIKNYFLAIGVTPEQK